MNSAGCRKRLKEWARAISRLRKATFTRMNASSQTRGSRRQLFLSMGTPQFPSHGFELDRVLEDRVVAVPLHEIGTPHERAMLRRAPVVMPEVEVMEVDRVLEGLSDQRAFLAE